METWYRMPSGKVRHSSGQLREVAEIQDQIDDGRIELVDYIETEQYKKEQDAAVSAVSAEKRMEKLSQIRVIEEKANRSMRALLLDPNNLKEREYLASYESDIEAIRKDL